MFDDKSFFDFIKNRIKLMKLLPFLFLFLKWKSVTNFKFADKLKNPFLKEAFQLLFDGEELNLLIITMPLAYFDRNSAGYPIGGSYNFVKKIEEKYISLGGKINYNNGVKRIIIENDVAKGFLLNDDAKVYSDISISAADWYYTMFEALDGKYADKAMLELKEQKSLNVFYSIFLISLGVKRTFDDSPHFFRFPLTKDLVSPDGTIYSRLEVHTYNYDPTLASKGKTVVSISLNTRNSDYWIDLRKSDKELYNRNKQDFAQQIIEIIENKFGDIKENIEITDIATPATHYRYTNSWKGSTQGWLPPKNLLKKSPVNTEIQGFKNFYYSSHWSVPGGGLPIAIKTARDTAKIICKKHKIKFSTER